MPPENAYDGNYNTCYSVKDRDTAGNYLKLFLDSVYQISHVNVTNRLTHTDRFGGTRVKVIKRGLKDGETDCGTVTGMGFRRDR